MCHEWGLLWLEQDWSRPIENALVTVEQIPGASLLQYADAGHGVLLQHDRELAAIISTWLDGRQGASDAGSA